jgi:predicted DNA-binding transcriptional regulator AlpA
MKKPQKSKPIVKPTPAPAPLEALLHRPSFGTTNLQTPSNIERRLIGPKDLPSMGINYSSTHLRRMWKAGKFPEPVYPSERRFAWRIADLEDWIAKVGK